MIHDAANPFPGLRPFQRGEEHLFFGRERQIDAMVDALGANRFLAVVGTSGCGKSSLVNCGLLPALHLGLLADAGSSWRVVHCRPGADPLGALAAALAAPGVLYRETERGIPLVEIVDTRLRMSRRGLVDVYVQARRPADQNLLVVVDQFEELFRYRDVVERRESGSSEPETRAFVKLLLEAVRAPDQPIFVALTMRSDFLGDCARFAGLPEAINRGQFLVPRMTRHERRQAIAGPVKVAGGQLDPVLETRLVNDVGNDPDQLSILQHALRQTWNIWTADDTEALTVAHYETVGTMEAALDQHAERAYAGLTNDGQRALCERVFRALTDTGTDARGIRRPTPLGELCAIVSAHRTQVRPILDVFRAPEQAFLMPPAGEPLDDDSVIDISHESLMRNWRRLRRWSEDEAESASIYRRLVQSAELHAQDRASLYRGAELQVARQWLDEQRPNPAWAAQYDDRLDLVSTFVEASEAEAERRAAAAQKRRRVRLLLAALVVFILLTSALVALVITDGERALAKQAEVKAENARVAAVRAQGDAEKAKEEAERNARRAIEEASIGWAMGNSDHDPSMAALSLLATTPEDIGSSWTRTYRRLLQRPLAEALFNLPGPALQAAWHPGGRSFATFAGGRIQVHGDGVGDWPAKEVSTLAWSPDGRWLMTVEAKRLNLRSGDEHHLLDEQVIDARFLEDGRLALVGELAGCGAAAPCLEIARIDDDGGLRRLSQRRAAPGLRGGTLRTEGDFVFGRFIVDDDRGKPRHEARLYPVTREGAGPAARFALPTSISRHAIKAVSVAFDGTGLAFASGDFVYLWPAPEPGKLVLADRAKSSRGGAPFRLDAHSWVYTIASSHDGARRAAGTDRGVVVWDRDGQQVGYARTRDAVRHLAWSPVDRRFRDTEGVRRKNPENARLLSLSIGGDLVLRYRDATPLAAMRHPGDALRGLGANHQVSSGAVSFGPTGKRALSIGADQTARIWTLDALALKLSHPHGVGRVAWRPDDSALLVAAASSAESAQRVRIWPLTGPASPTSIEAGPGHHWDVAWSRDGLRFAVGASSADKKHSVQIWAASKRAEGGWRPLDPRPRGGRVHDLAWSPDGCLLAVGAYDGKTLVLTRDGERVQDLDDARAGEYIRHVAWRPDPRATPGCADAPRPYALVTSSSDKRARTYAGTWPKTGAWALEQTVVFDKWAQGSAWRPAEGDLVVTASGGRVALSEAEREMKPEKVPVSRAWDPTGALVAYLPLASTNRLPIWSPDGRHLALVADKAFGFWSLDALRGGGAPAPVVTPHAGEPDLSWHPGSQLAVATSADRVLRFWSPDGRLQAEVEADDAILDVEWSPGGDFLAVAAANGDALVLPLTVEAIEAPHRYLKGRVRGCLPARYRLEFLRQSPEEAAAACAARIGWPPPSTPEGR